MIWQSLKLADEYMGVHYTIPFITVIMFDILYSIKFLKEGYFLIMPVYVD